jgi:hypothetical protein
MDDMGLFSTRPEEPNEWAGLPSEPVESRPAAEALDAAVVSSHALSMWGPTVESVAIPVVPVAEESAPREKSGETDPTPPEEA